MASTNATAPDTYSGDVPVATPSIAGTLQDLATEYGARWRQAFAAMPQAIATGRAMGNKIIGYTPIPQSFVDDAAEFIWQHSRHRRCGAIE